MTRAVPGSRPRVRGADGARLPVAVVAATSVGMIGANLQPMLVGAIMDGFGLSAGEAGLAGAAAAAALSTRVRGRQAAGGR